MVKFRVSSKVALILAFAYSAIYIPFSLFMFLGILVYLEFGFYLLAVAAFGVLMVPTVLFALIWRQLKLMGINMDLPSLYRRLSK